MRRISATLVFAGALALVLAAQPAPAVRGVVFDDLNGNGVRDEGERGVAGVAVSNQRDVVRTGADGRYELPAGRGHGLVYVSIPAGYRTTAAPWRPIDAPDRPAVPRFSSRRYPCPAP